MSIIPAKKSLFTADTVFDRPVAQGSALLARLDNRVTDVALAVLGTLAFTTAVVGSIAATVFIGWSLLPIVVVVSAVVLGAGIFYVKSHFKRYHDPYMVYRYQQQALHLCKRLSYLDRIDFLKGKQEDEKKVIKKHLLRPLTTLIGMHRSLDNILRYYILEPIEFKKAFDLEIKYLELPEAFALYQQIRQVARNHPQYDISAFTSPEVQREWKDKLHAYLEQKGTEVIDSTAATAGDPFDQHITLLDQTGNIIKGFFEYGLFTEGKDAFDLLYAPRLRQQKEYRDFTQRYCPEISEARRLDKLRIECYQGHSVHHMLQKEQQRILVGVDEIQADHEQKTRTIKQGYNQILHAIALRRPQTPEERTTDEEHHAFFTNKQAQEEEVLEREYADKLDRYMQKGISTDFVDMLTALQEHKQALDRSYIDTFSISLERPINIFVRNSSTEIDRYRRLFGDYYNHFMQLVEQNG